MSFVGSNSSIARSRSIKKALKKKPKITVDKRNVNPVYRPVLRCDIPTQILYGGSSSGKSYAMALFVVIWLLQGRSIIITRQVANTLRKSVFSEVTKAIYRYGFSEHIKINKTEMSMVSEYSDGCIMFLGLDDEEKIKSITPKKADAFDVVWQEEATENSESSFNQLGLRMRGRTKFRKKRILTFNPIYQSHWIYKRFFDDKRTAQQRRFKDDNLLILKTTYKDNNFLESDEIKVLLDLKNTSPYHYSVYALGNFGVLGSRIFENVIVEAFNENEIIGDNRIGSDFGFTNDPTTAIYTKYDRKNKRIYIYDEFYRIGVKSKPLAKLYQSKTNLHPNTKNAIIYGDSAEPRLMAELRGLGIKIYGTVDKAILKRIDWLQQHTFIVHPRCKHTIEEFLLYVWMERDGVAYNEPVDKNNHCMDALAYGYCKDWTHSGKIVGSKSTLY